jgi:excisionase family DNA binding protein
VADRLLTTTEAASLLGVTRRYVTTLVRGGKLPAQESVRGYLILASDVRRYTPVPRGRPKKVG